MRQKSSMCSPPPVSACLHIPDAKQRTAELLHTAPGLLARVRECPWPWAEASFSLGLQLCRAQCLKFSFSSAAFVCEQVGILGLRGAAEQPGVEGAQPNCASASAGSKMVLPHPGLFVLKLAVLCFQDCWFFARPGELSGPSLRGCVAGLCVMASATPGYGQLWVWTNRQPQISGTWEYLQL